MDDGQSATGPLTGVRVVEMGHLLAGPFCGHLLADFGAEVIKLEPPGRGDPMREWGHHKINGHSLWWPILARNKKSVTLDLRTDRGQAIAKELITQSDMVVENFRPGTLERWGLGFDELSKLNPGLVCVRVTGYGQDGPYAPRASYGAIGEAMGGIRFITGDPDRPPSRTGISLGDSLAGTLAALGGLVALHARQQTGRGQVVDSAIYEAVLTYMESMIPEYQLGGHTRGRNGPILPNVAPSNVYETADDDYILVAANQDSVFERLAACMKRPDLATDPRFRTHTERGTNQRELDELISEWTRQHPVRWLLDTLNEEGIPAGQVYTAADMIKDQHFQARDAIVTMPHAAFGEIAMQGVFPKLSSTPGRIHHVGPELGQHNDEIYGELLGLTTDEISQLRLDKTI
jgi:formyl-CoA transferase